MGLALAAARAGFGFHGSQGRFEFVVRRAAPGFAAESARKEPPGFVVLGVKIAADPAEPVGDAQFLPAIGAKVSTSRTG